MYFLVGNRVERRKLSENCNEISVFIKAVNYLTAKVTVSLSVPLG